MSFYELFEEELDGKTFDSKEAFNAEVLRISADLEEELGKAERWAKSGAPEVYEQLGVTIKDVYPEEEEEE